MKTLKRAGLGFFIGVFVGNIISALVGWPDAFVPHASSVSDLLAACRLTPADAAEAVLSAL